MKLIFLFPPSSRAGRRRCRRDSREQKTMTFAIFFLLCVVFISSTIIRRRRLLECLENVFVFNEWKLWKSSSEFFISTETPRHFTTRVSVKVTKWTIFQLAVINWKYLIRMESVEAMWTRSTWLRQADSSHHRDCCLVVNNWNQQRITSHQLRYCFTSKSKSIHSPISRGEKIASSSTTRLGCVYFWHIRTEEKFIWIIFHLINACLSSVMPCQLWRWSSASWFSHFFSFSPKSQGWRGCKILFFFLTRSLLCVSNHTRN